MVSISNKNAISQRIGLGFTGVLLVAGVTFYIAKQGVNERRRLEMEEHRAARLNSSRSPDSKQQS